MKGATHAPALYIQSEGEDLSTRVALNLTRAKERIVVRITGGCGDMSQEDGHNLCDKFGDAFAGFSGALLFGGSQMRLRDNPSVIVPGITEIAPEIRGRCPNAVVLGIVPRVEQLKLWSTGLVVSDESSKPYVTVVHPDQDLCVIVQRSADCAVIWDAEYRFAELVVAHLIAIDWKPLLVVYNGGPTTEKEVRCWADRKWPILLVKNSGRAADMFASDKRFLRDHSTIRVADNTATAIRAALMKYGVLQSGVAMLRAVR